MSATPGIDDDEGTIIEPAFIKGAQLPHFAEEEREIFDKAHEPLVTEVDGLPMTVSGRLLRSYIMQEGFSDHHIEVFNRWIAHTAINNVSGRMLTLRDGNVVCFENLKIFAPRYTRDGKVLPMTPQLAREQGITYGGDWMVDVVLRKGSYDGPELDRKANICIGTVPTMLKSRNCILHGKTADEMSLFGEDPKDPGGYFIVGGTEKVILLQEQLVTNKILLFMSANTKGSPVIRMTASTERGTALIELAISKTGIVKIRFPSMRDAKLNKKYRSLNVMRLFRLHGISSADEIKDIIALFMKPEEVHKSMLKFTQNIVDFMMFPDDIEIMAAKMDKSKVPQEEKMAEINRVLETDFFPHLNNIQGLDGETPEEYTVRVAKSKLYLLAIMTARMLEFLAGFRKVDDRDSWSNKRVEGAGRMMEQLFRNAWRKTLGFVQAAIENGSIKDLNGVVEKIRYSIITDTFHDSFITSNWGVKGTQMKNNVAQTLVRDNPTAFMAHLNTVDVPISRTDRQLDLRLVQPTQYGFICPASTPEGENAGLVKSLSITAKVSLERNDSDILRVLLGDQGKGITQKVTLNYGENPAWNDMLMVNGKFVGWCDGSSVRDYLISQRRIGALPFDMSVIKEDNWVYVDISPSRLVRPLLIVDPDQKLAIDRLNLRGASNHILMTSGAMELMSPWEQEYIKVAATQEDIQKRIQNIDNAVEAQIVAQNNYDTVVKGGVVIIESYVEEKLTKVPLTLEEAKQRLDDANAALAKERAHQPYTHCELDSLAILGIAAALIPWPNHNQAPRNTYQVSMGKQALATAYHSNDKQRFDGKTKTLPFANRPLVETDMYDVVGLNQRAPGKNVTVAFLAYPFTEEDSFIFKKEFLQNGGFRIEASIVYKIIVKHSGEVVETLTKPDPRPGEPKDRYRYINMGDARSPMNGLPMLGAPLRQGDCVIGKMQHVPATKEVHNESAILRVGDEGIVDKILVTSDNKTTVVQVKLRIHRVPQPGDKFAPRNAQKGTIGEVVSDCDLPCTETGITPDIIVNTHSIPTRMTISYIMEIIAGLHAAFRGVQINGGAFKPFNLKEYRETVKEYGYQEFGHQKMMSGLSGKPLETSVYTGPVYMQALKHHVINKIQARGIGQVKPMTRQAPKGKGNGGGLRFGPHGRCGDQNHCRFQSQGATQSNSGKILCI